MKAKVVEPLFNLTESGEGESDMTYEEFAEKRRTGMLSYKFDTSASLAFINKLPPDFKWVHLVWAWVWTAYPRVAYPPREQERR